MAYTQMCGIVIREVQVGEADKIVHLLTDRAGIVSASAKGAMRVKSKLVSATGLLTYSSFSLYEGKAMYIIEDAKVLNQFWNLRKDVVDLSTAVYFLELIRRLSRRDPDIRTILVRRGNGAAVIDFRVGNQLVFRPVGIDGVGKQPFDLHRIGALSSQKRRRLKGPHTGFQHKILSIQGNAGKQGVSLQPADGVFSQILNQLRHHFGRRAGVRLVVKNNGVLDMLHHHAVVVDNHSPLAVFVQIPAFHKALGMGVHDNQKGTVRNQGKGLPGDKNIPVLPAFSTVSTRAPARVCSRFSTT